jgi:tetratricopeptide (TPR) repeat protein
MRFGARAGGWCSAAIALAASLLAAISGAALAQQSPTTPKTQQALISPSARCSEPIARIASVQGVVELRSLTASAWQRAQLNDALCLNDNIRVGQHSRASVQYSADITVQFDQNSFVTLVEAKDKVSIWTQMWRGALHFITRSRKPFRVITPFVNASVEGTEVYIALAKDRADLTVFEGKLDVANDAGQILLSSGESATVQGLEAITDDDQFRTLKARAPQRVLIAKPRDAVQWALYYPPVIDVRPGENVHPNLKAATEQFRAGNTAEAFAELDRVPVDNWDAQYFIYRASLLLYVGREQEAQADLAQALQQDAKKSDALALQAIIAVVQSDKEQGLSLAQKAVAADPSSAAAQIALSYAQQAIFKLEAALQSAEQAAKLDANNALAYARIAELQLSQGDLDKALAAAKRATELNPNLARTQSILGFSYLTRIDTKNAKETFSKAIELDSADPLPHLGLGLAKIREGKLEEGRRDIEQAVILDPNNSLIRSYVGKAYYEEKRDELAGKQFEIAKQLDPKDPTPFFYDAIRLQTDNRPVEALQGLGKSVELNDSRATYRSRLLLDQDLAARNANVTAAFETLGFERLALVHGVRTLEFEPSNFSAHRTLADFYELMPRFQIARDSEILQARLLQPANSVPFHYRAAVDGLDALHYSTAFAPTGWGEYSSLLDAPTSRARLDALVGTEGTNSDNIAVSKSAGSLSVDLGQFHFETDGHRPNKDINQNIYGLSAQWEISTKLTALVEARSLDEQSGYTNFTFFDTENSEQSSHFRFANDVQSWRLGLRYQPRRDLTALVSYTHFDQKDRVLEIFPGFDLTEEDRSRFFESRMLMQFGLVHVDAGLGYLRGRQQSQFVGEPADNGRSSHRNAYVYLGVPLSQKAHITVGTSLDRLTNLDFSRRQLSPKLGATWSPAQTLTLRLAGFKTLKRPFLTQQTLEPTSVAGFNQFFDDINGTKTKVWGFGIDKSFRNTVFLGAEFLQRRLSEIPLGVEQTSIDERFATAYVYTVIGSRWSLGTKYENEHLSNQRGEFRPYLFAYYRTHKFPIEARYFNPGGLFARVRTTFIQQQGKFCEMSDIGCKLQSGKDQFSVSDLSIGYRFKNPKAIVALELRNIFDKKFRFQELDIESLTLPPQRVLALRASLAF